MTTISIEKVAINTAAAASGGGVGLAFSEDVANALRKTADAAIKACGLKRRSLSKRADCKYVASSRWTGGQKNLRRETPCLVFPLRMGQRNILDSGFLSTASLPLTLSNQSLTIESNIMHD